MECKREIVDRRVVLLLRHGDSRQDHLKRYVGQTDTPLNERGRVQSDVLCRELAGISFARFYCSTLRRSLETAELIVGNSAAIVTQVPELSEISMGMWDGRSVDEVQCAFPDEYRRRGEDPAQHAAPGGESFSDLQKRVVPAFEKILQESDGPIVIVGHAGVNRVILTHLLGMPLGNLFRIGQDYACLNVLVREKGFFKVQTMNLSTLTECNHAVLSEFLRCIEKVNAGS